jgi:nitrite reductase/ring-hydroxylating ferredoxin subunit
MEKIEIGPVEALKKRGFLNFRFKEQGIQRDGFVAFSGQHLVAYENRCRHLPVSLDYGDGNILSPDKKFFQCHTHGALYDPGSGYCVSGPCAGASLRKLDVMEENGKIYLLNSSGDFEG